jgi:hypothetical protein
VEVIIRVTKKKTIYVYGDTLEHKSHKYVDKKYKDGKWQYIYDYMLGGNQKKDMQAANKEFLTLQEDAYQKELKQNKAWTDLQNAYSKGKQVQEQATAEFEKYGHFGQAATHIPEADKAIANRTNIYNDAASTFQDAYNKELAAYDRKLAAESKYYKTLLGKIDIAKAKIRKIFSKLKKRRQ